MKKNHVRSTTSAHVLAIGQNRGKKNKTNSQSIWKRKVHVGMSSNGSKIKPNFDVPDVRDPKDATSFHFGEKGHQRRNFSKYL